MATDLYSTHANDGTIYPNTSAINSSGPSATDGTELIAVGFNNYQSGRQQALLNYAGLTPTGVVESNTISQELEAIGKGFAVGPGFGVEWWLADDPSVTGHRVLLLAGQGIAIASYPELTAAVYVGDANNAAVAAGGGFFYKSTDSAGATPSTSGTYLQLPDARGYALRGLDVAASVDPDGASRFLGDVQGTSIQGHAHEFNKTPINAAGSGSLNVYSSATNSTSQVFGVIDYSSGAVTVSTESRMVNVSTNFGITY